MTSIQQVQKTFKEEFYQCFPEVKVVNGKLINGYRNTREDSERIDETVKASFEKIFDERFKEKKSGAFETKESILSKRKWSIALIACAGIAVAVAIASFTILRNYDLLLKIVHYLRNYYPPRKCLHSTCDDPIMQMLFTKVKSISFKTGLISSIAAAVLSVGSLLLNFAKIRRYQNKIYCESKGNKAITDFLNNGLTYHEFKTKYNHLFWHNVLNNQDLILMLARDCLMMSPYKFLEKHQITTNNFPVIKQILDSKDRAG